MSFTYTKEGRELNFLLNNKNWDILFKLLNQFCYYRGWSLSKDWRYLSLYSTMKNDFMKSLIKQKRKRLELETLKDWFIDFLKSFDNVVLTDLDLQVIRKTVLKIKEQL